MKAIIVATAQTHYQSTSLMEFNLANTNKNPYSSEMVGYQDFETIKQARKYLKDRAEMYYQNDLKAISLHLHRNSLTLDAVNASIITGSERLDFMESSNRKYIR